MNLESLNNERERIENEINHLNEVLAQLENARRDMSEAEYNREREDINRHLEQETQIRERMNNTLRAYDNMYSNLKALNDLETIVPRDRIDIQEMNVVRERRQAEIIRDRQILPEELQQEIRDRIINEKNNTQTVNESISEAGDSTDLSESNPQIEETPVISEEPSVIDGQFTETPSVEEVNSSSKEETPVVSPSTNQEENVINLPEHLDIPVEKSLVPTDSPVVEENQEREETPTEEQTNGREMKPLEVKARKAWNWVKNNKKKILIAVGITAVTVAAVVTISQLLPAITAAVKASQVSNLAASMLTNGSMYYSAIATEQVALHSANTALASAIQSLTGGIASFNTATGVWTIGGAELSSFAASASATATAAATKVSALSTTALGLGLGGVLSAGAGLLMNGKRVPPTETYKYVKSEMDKQIKDFDEEKLNTLAETITNNEELTNREKKKLFNKVKRELSARDAKSKLANIKNKFTRTEEVQVEENSQEQTQEQVHESVQGPIEMPKIEPVNEQEPDFQMPEVEHTNEQKLDIQLPKPEEEQELDMQMPEELKEELNGGRHR